MEVSGLGFETVAGLPRQGYDVAGSGDAMGNGYRISDEYSVEIHGLSSRKTGFETGSDQMIETNKPGETNDCITFAKGCMYKR